MPLGERVPLELERQRGVPLERPFRDAGFFMDGRKPESQKFLFFIPWLQLVYYTLALVLPKSTTLSRVRQGVDNSLTSPFLNYVVCYRC